MAVTIENTVDLFSVVAAVKYTDDFEAYSTGSLDGQGDWNVVVGGISVYDDSGNNEIYSTTAANYCLAYYDKVLSDDQYAKITITYAGSVTEASWIGVVVRMSDDGSTYYLYHARGGSSNTRYLEGKSGGSTWDIASTSDPTSDDDILELRVEGSTITCLINGSVDTNLGAAVSPATGNNGVYTDTRVTSGKAGVGGYSNAGAHRADDWEAGNL